MVARDYKRDNHSLGTAFLGDYMCIERSPKGIKAAPREPTVKMFVGHPVLLHDEL